MNIFFLLTPKTACAYLRAEDSLRQALERMESSSYAALPILGKDGSYRGTLTEGDVLRAIKSRNLTDLRDMEKVGIMDIAHRRDNAPVSVDARVENLLSSAIEQNFIPVVDDRDTFIGIITRKAVLQYCMERYMAREEPTPMLDNDE